MKDIKLSYSILKLKTKFINKISVLIYLKIKKIIMFFNVKFFNIKNHQKILS